MSVKFPFLDKQELALSINGENTMDVSQFHGIPWYSMSPNYWKDFLTKTYNYGMEETTDQFGIP